MDERRLEGRLDTHNEAGDRLDLEREAPQGLSARGVAAVIAGWLFPGAGHLVAGRWKRGLLLGGLLVGAFALGLYLHGHLATFDRSNLLSIVFVFSDLGSGLLYVGSLLTGIGLDLKAETPTFEYGTSLLHLVGLLNYLVALDAYDIAAGRKP
jgi:hypothetical protein